jgi:hypothetical protein
MGQGGTLTDRVIMADVMDTSDLNLGAVNTADQLRDKLRDVHIRADKPSMRDLEARARSRQALLSKTTVAEMLRGTRFPTKAVMLAFLRACDVRNDDMESWQRAWERAAAGKGGQNPRRAANLWQFSDPGPITLICARLPSGQKSRLAKPANPNYTELQSFADLDALIELYGHIRAENPTMQVFFKPAPKVEPDDLSGHVVLLGGFVWNEITEQMLEMSHLPVRQIEDPSVTTGEIFVVGSDGEEKKYLPKWTTRGKKIQEDVGLLARRVNPLNSNRTLTICNGIHSRGVLGAVRALADMRSRELRESNDTYIAESFADTSDFAILMRVAVIDGRTITPDFHNSDNILYQWPSGDSG